MNIYFTASLAAKHKYLENYELIISTLEKRGHHVIADHIIRSSEDEIKLRSRDERLAFHEKVENWIASCDFVIAETSSPGTSMGYEIALALRMGKPVLVLYSEGDPPSLFGEHPDEKLVVEEYTHKKLEQIIDEFIFYVEGKHDLRFTFFITPRIAHYLDKVSLHYKIRKAAYIRQLIEKDMRENKL